MKDTAPHLVLKARRTLDLPVRVTLFRAWCPATGEVLESRGLDTLLQSIARDLARFPSYNTWNIQEVEGGR